MGFVLLFFFFDTGYKTKKGSYLFLFCWKGYNAHSVKYSQILLKELKTLIFYFFLTANSDKSLNTIGLVCSLERSLKSAFHAITKKLMLDVSSSEFEV